MSSTTIELKALEDAPGYERAVSPATSCSTCANFQLRWCTLYDFNANPAWTCESWAARAPSSKDVWPANVPATEDPRQVITTTKAQKPASFAIFKDTTGKYRWVLKSGNSFEDRDREVVTTKALARDVHRTDQTGDYGPLRWWHVGNPQWQNPMDWRSVVAGKGVDLGDCDFSAMEGPILIESGTFKSEKLGAAIASKADQFRASLGFSHPINEPDVDGVFHHIKRFERSLTPANKASNTRTGLVVTKERTMDAAKLAQFKEVVGEDLANEVLADAQSTTKEARSAGIREKEVQEPSIDSMQAQVALLIEQIATFKAKAEDVVTNGTKNKPVVPSAIVSDKAAEGSPAEEAGESPEEEDAEGDGDEVYIGDMTGPEFVTMLHGALAPLFEQHTKALDLHGKIAAAADSMKEMKSYLGGMTQKEAKYTELQDQVTLLSTTLKEAQDQLSDLTGEVPRELNRPRGAAYKASEGVDNLVPTGHPMYQTDTEQPAPQSPLSWIDSFVEHQQQTPVQHAAVVQGRNGQTG